MLGHEMQMKKNQMWQGTCTPSSSSSWSSRSFSSGMIRSCAQGGQWRYVGSGVGRVGCGPVDQEVVREQSAVAMTVVAARKVKTRVLGQEKSKVRAPEFVHVVATATAGVLKTTEVVAGQSIVIAAIEGGKVTVTTVGPPTVTGALTGV